MVVVVHVFPRRFSFREATVSFTIICAEINVLEDCWRQAVLTGIQNYSKPCADLRRSWIFPWKEWYRIKRSRDAGLAWLHGISGRGSHGRPSDHLGGSNRTKKKSRTFHRRSRCKGWLETLKQWLTRIFQPSKDPFWGTVWSGEATRRWNVESIDWLIDWLTDSSIDWLI